MGEVCHWEHVLRFQKPIPFTVSPLSPLCHVTDISYELLLQCHAYLSASLRPDMMVIDSPSETGSPI